MQPRCFKLGTVVFFVLLLAAAGGWAPAQAADAHRDPKLGLVSDRARGNQRYLVILVNFPNVAPQKPLEAVKERAVPKVDQWYRAASYQQTRFTGTVKGPYTLPAPVETYKVSPYNFQVDSNRVYALVRDALSLAEEDGAALNAFDVVAVIHRCFTRPGQGYGMICYCANPGMLSKVGRGRANYVPIRTKRGTTFNKGVVVMAENFHLGFLVHDLAHAIGGVLDGKRLVGDLYDFQAQSSPRSRFQIHDAAVYLGPWDLLSQHFIQQGQGPPGFSLFTKIRMGYVKPEQVMLVPPGKTSLARLSPLGEGGPLLGIKIPLGRERYLLVENRQPLQVDRVLPASGVMIYEVDETKEEGFGLVKTKSADPSDRSFARAPFGVEGQSALAFVDPRANLAVVPIIKQGYDYLVLVTGASEAKAAEKVARGLQGRKDSQALKKRLPQVLELLAAGKVSAAAAVLETP
ncbi:MAG: hypothetical protein AB1491_10325 [Thermodesulfobacteriota bacterium]